jgi:hypothetical protein
MIRNLKWERGSEAGSWNPRAKEETMEGTNMHYCRQFKSARFQTCKVNMVEKVNKKEKQIRKGNKNKIK